MVACTVNQIQREQNTSTIQIQIQFLFVNMPSFHKIPFAYIDQKSLLVHRLLDYENEESVDKFVTGGGTGKGDTGRAALWTNPGLEFSPQTSVQT